MPEQEKPKTLQSRHNLIIAIMKKMFLMLLVFAACFTFTGCATIMGGKITECQRTKPKPGEPARQLRIWPLIFQIWEPVGLIIDFSTGAIYKPCKTESKDKK